MENNMNATTGIIDILIDAINKKYDNIRDFNSLNVNLSEEDYELMIPVIDSIIEGENNSIGKLQQLVDLLSGSEEDIEEGKQDTIELIDNSDEFMESVTSMKKKLKLSENFDNVIDDVQAVASTTFVGANKEHDENKKKYEDAVEENEKLAKETVPEEGSTGKKVTSPALKKMHLSEELFTEASNSDLREKVREFVTDIINNALDNLVMVVNSAFPEYDPDWFNDDIDYEVKTIGKQVQTLANVIVNGLFKDAINESINPVNESLKEDLNVNDEELSLIVKYLESELGHTWSDISDEKKIRQLLNKIHQYDASLFNPVNESLKEDLDEGDYDNLQSDVYNALADVVYKYHWKGISQAEVERAIEWFEIKFFEDEFEEELKESLEYQIAREQIKRFNEGKMPKNWNVNSYLNKLVESRHITKKEAKSLKEWYSKNK